ncbi:MAG: polyketide cyclase [Rhodoglobus sp.]|nr:polyketide cyclase [Rhodoglobus sp.]
MSSATEIVEDYHRAWTTGDVERALLLVADDAICSAPDPQVSTKEHWRSYLGGFAPRLTAAPEVTRMTDSNRVALWYYPQTETTKTTLASELFVVENDLIVEIRLAFDRLGYVPAQAAG